MSSEHDFTECSLGSGAVLEQEVEPRYRLSRPCLLGLTFYLKEDG